MHRAQIDPIKCSKTQVDPRVRLVVSLPSEFYYFFVKTVQTSKFLAFFQTKKCSYNVKKKIS